MIEHIVALLMFVGPDIKEHRIQIDPNTGKASMSICMKHKREASRPRTTIFTRGSLQVRREDRN